MGREEDTIAPWVVTRYVWTILFFKPLAPSPRSSYTRRVTGVDDKPPDLLLSAQTGPMRVVGEMRAAARLRRTGKPPFVSRKRHRHRIVIGRVSQRKRRFGLLDENVELKKTYALFV